MITPGQKHISDESLGAWLQQELWLPRGFVNTLFAQDRVRAAGNPLTSTAPIPRRAKVWLLEQTMQEDLDKADLADVPAPVVRYEDDHVLVVDKPAGLLIHSDGTGKSDTQTERVQKYLRSSGHTSPAFHVHRLDVGTTGCVLFAKHSFALRSLDTMMRERRIHRTYLAAVCGVTATTGSIRQPIGRDRHHAGAFRISATGKPAVTHYTRIAVDSRTSISLLKCEIETGRTHQIRVHLASLGHPVIGDATYAGMTGDEGWRWSGPGQALHGWRISFQHPYTKEFLSIEAPIPVSVKSLFPEDADWER